MENETAQNGWKQLSSDTDNDYLYKTFPTGTMAAAIKSMNHISNALENSGLEKVVHVSLGGEMLTISINSPADQPLDNKHFELAKQLDGLLHNK